MFRFSLLLLSFSLFVFTSCEKCKSCRYSYDVVTISQGVNGEEEVVYQVENQILLAEDGVTQFGEDCVKNGEESTIEQYYQEKKDTTVILNFDFTCTEN